MAHLRIQRTRSEIHRVYLWKAKDIFKLYCIRWTLYISFHSTFLWELGALNVNKPTPFFVIFGCVGAHCFKIALGMHTIKLLCETTSAISCIIIHWNMVNTPVLYTVFSVLNYLLRFRLYNVFLTLNKYELSTSQH